MRKLKNRKLSIFLIFLIFVVSFSISTTFAEDLNETNITKNDFEISEIERCDNSNCDFFQFWNCSCWHGTIPYFSLNFF